MIRGVIDTLIDALIYALIDALIDAVPVITSAGFILVGPDAHLAGLGRS